MKRKRKTPLLLALIFVFIISFTLIGTLIDKWPALAKDKDNNASPVAVNNNAVDIFENAGDEEESDEIINANGYIDNNVNEEVDDIMKAPTPSLEGTSYVDEQGNTIIKNTDDILVLVNKKRNLPSDYKPNDLVIPNVKFPFEEKLEKKYMRSEAATALEELFNTAKEDGINLFAVSGYRSYKTQQSLFAAYAKKHGEEAANMFSAFAGQSEHQTGLAMDVSCQSVGFQLTDKFGQTPEGQWLKENAHRFGFIIRYPENRTEDTGYIFEPWHIRYVGIEAAEYIKENDLILEDYFSDPSL